MKRLTFPSPYPNANQKLGKYALSLIAKLNIVWQPIVYALTRRAEVRVWAVKTRQGQVFWKAYDPVSGRTFSFTSEDEVRLWIDQRYYQ